MTGVMVVSASAAICSVAGAAICSVTVAMSVVVGVRVRIGSISRGNFRLHNRTATSIYSSGDNAHGIDRVKGDRSAKERLGA